PHHDSLLSCWCIREGLTYVSRMTGRKTALTLGGGPRARQAQRDTADGLRWCQMHSGRRLFPIFESCLLIRQDSKSWKATEQETGVRKLCHYCDKEEPGKYGTLCDALP